MSHPGQVLQKDELNESWVDLHYKNGSSSENSSNGGGSPKTETSLQLSGIYAPLNIEKLLQDAQRESGQNSREASARTSPKAIHSPAEHTHSPAEHTTQEVPMDWMWDWSSCPEKNQGREQAFRLKNAADKRRGLTLRNSRVMKTSIFTKENLAVLVASHVSVFALGAFVMYLFLRKSEGQQIAIQS